MLKPMYKKNSSKLPSFNNFKLSLVKAEKVVNPPQKPVVKKIIQFEFSVSFLRKYPKTIPINKEPIVLTNNVFNGIVELSISILEIRYLDTLPKPPPINTKIKFLSIY